MKFPNWFDFNDTSDVLTLAVFRSIGGKSISIKSAQICPFLLNKRLIGILLRVFCAFTSTIFTCLMQFIIISAIFARGLMSMCTPNWPLIIAALSGFAPGETRNKKVKRVEKLSQLRTISPVAQHWNRIAWQPTWQLETQPHISHQFAENLRQTDFITPAFHRTANQWRCVCWKITSVIALFLLVETVVKVGTIVARLYLGTHMVLK